jgi:hypothetical protein
VGENKGEGAFKLFSFFLFPLHSAGEGKGEGVFLDFPHFAGKICKMGIN